MAYLASQAGSSKKLIANQYQNGQLAMGWDGNKLHYFFNGAEISQTNESQIKMIVEYYNSPWISEQTPDHIRSEEFDVFGFYKDINGYIYVNTSKGRLSF